MKTSLDKLLEHFPVATCFVLVTCGGFPDQIWGTSLKGGDVCLLFTIQDTPITSFLIAPPPKREITWARVSRGGCIWISEEEALQLEPAWKDAYYTLY